VQESAIAQREHDERVNAQREADANLRAAQAALQTARLNLGYTQVRARWRPRGPHRGHRGQPGGRCRRPVLTTLVSVSPIYASFDADEQVVAPSPGWRRQGHRARARSNTFRCRWAPARRRQPFNGHLQLMDNQVDARSGTVRVRAVFDNADGSLMPGQFARIRMGQARAPGRADQRARRGHGPEQVRLVVGADNKAEYREVQLGAPVDGLRVVTSGLKAGERIVVNGLQRVRPGAVSRPGRAHGRQGRTAG
jgi:multidrug efflux system membrane fusion protein